MSDNAQEKAKLLIKEQAELVMGEYRPRLEAIEKALAKGDSTAELTATIEKMDSKISELQAALDATNATMKSANFTTGSDSNDRIEADYTASFVKSLTGSRLSDAELSLVADYHKSWNVSANTAAGYAIPKAMAAEIIRQVETTVPFFSLSGSYTTASKEVPFLVQTGKGTAGLATEVATSANTAEGTIEEVRIRAYDMDAEPSLTRELLEDAAFDLVGFLTQNAADDIADLFGNLIVNGTGNAQPKGLVASANTTSTYAVIKVVDANPASNTAMFDLDDLFEVKYDLNPRYTKNGNAWVVARSVAKEMRKFKDNQGQYLWQPSLQVGQPAVFDGDAVYESPYLAAATADALSAFFGDWKAGSAIVRHTGGSFALNDPYTNKRLVKIYIKERLGFGTIDARALRALKLA